MDPSKWQVIGAHRGASGAGERACSAPSPLPDLPDLFGAPGQAWV